MFTPSDEKLQDIMEEAADELISMIDMELDEGSWGSKVMRRCGDLGLDVHESIKMREVIEELICLRLTKSTLNRIRDDAGTEHAGPNRVFVQGAGWIEEHVPED